MSKNIHKLIAALDKISKSIEKIQPSLENIDEKIFSEYNCFIWKPRTNGLSPVKNVNKLDLDLLLGIDETKEILVKNTMHFARGLPANNVLLWGSRGMGKSSLIKSVHSMVCKEIENKLCLIEVEKNHLDTLNELIQLLKKFNHKFIIFCDDLSFEESNNHYKSLKTILEGGVEEKPSNVILYSTSNRRHLMPRNNINSSSNNDNININENFDEKISLSDRFGLWLGFHKCTHDQFISIVINYAKKFRVDDDKEDLIKRANQWSMTRGSRSGRVAWQFMQNYCAERNININKIN